MYLIFVYLSTLLISDFILPDLIKYGIIIKGYKKYVSKLSNNDLKDEQNSKQWI